MRIQATQTIKEAQLDEILKRISEGGMRAEITRKDNSISQITLLDKSSREIVKIDAPYSSLQVSYVVPEISYEVEFHADRLVGKRLALLQARRKQNYNGEQDHKILIKQIDDFVKQLAPDDYTGEKPYTIWRRKGFVSATGFLPASVQRVDSDTGRLVGDEVDWKDHQKIELDQPQDMPF